MRDPNVSLEFVDFVELKTRRASSERPAAWGTCESAAICRTPSSPQDSGAGDEG